MANAIHNNKIGEQKLIQVLNFFPCLKSLFCVGGCVRDLVLGKDPHDVDLCVPVAPQEVIRRLKAAGLPVLKSTNLEHGTVVTLINGVTYEITTFRRDLEYQGHQAKVEFIACDENNPQEVLEGLTTDLSRRDFTINAMAMGRDFQVQDPFNGQQDIDNRTIRCVGNPMDRFSEDLLRIIRAARFASRLGFAIAPDTMQAMQTLAPELIKNMKFEDRKAQGSEISIERIVDEFNKAFDAEHPSDFLKIMQDLGVLPAMIPEFANLEQMHQNPQHHPEGDVFTHTLEVVDRAPKGDIRWDALLHDVGKGIHFQEVPNQQYYTYHGHEDAGRGTPEAPSVIRNIGKRLKFPEELINNMESTISLHMRPLGFANTGFSGRALRRFHGDMGADAAEREKIRQRLMMLHMADAGQFWDEDFAQQIYTPQEVPDQSSTQKTIVQGRDLIARGFKPGPEMGRMIRETQEIFIETGITDPNQLIDMALGDSGIEPQDELS